MYVWEWEKTEEGQRALKRIEEAKERHANTPSMALTMPLRNIVDEARSMVRELGPEAFKSRIGHIHHFTDPASFADKTGQLRSTIESELSGESNDLEACLVKQAQSLDSLYDFFVQLSQYALTEGIREIQGPVNLALKAQSQCASTIDKFRKLQEKRFKNAERKEGIENEKKEL